MTLEAFDVPRKSVGWAREALSELDSQYKIFFSRVKAVPFTDIDPNTGEKFYKVKLSEDLPDTFGRKATETLNNLRHSFDQSLFAACVAIGKTPRKDIHFPWCISPKDLEGKFTGKKSEIPTELWDALRREEPYPTGDGYAGGDDLVREVAKLANRKHTIGLQLGGFIAGGTTPGISGQFDGLKVPHFRWDTVKNEVTLLIYRGNPQIKNNYQFGFQVVFNEAGLLQRTQIQTGLEAFLAKAERVLKSLESEATKIIGS